MLLKVNRNVFVRDRLDKLGPARTACHLVLWLAPALIKAPGGIPSSIALPV